MNRRPDRPIDILVCTFRRPQVARTLASLDAQELPAGHTLRIVVADNDDHPSARDTVLAAAERMRHEVIYLHAPARNISVARNACLDAADADRVAFIDDDETAAPGWLAALLDCVDRTGADAAFGPVQAVYGPDAPDWIRRQDHHSTIAQRRAGVVETGNAGNVMIRWRATPWQHERFDPALGRSGGEDTEFFFRLRRLGARFEIAEHARTFEPVDPKRLTFGWLCRRKFRTGQSYTNAAAGQAARIGLLAAAAAKVVYCMGAAAVRVNRPDETRFWMLRGIFHAGVCAGCLSVPQAQLYGE